MEEFLPSEVARLILGFLKENQCEKSWKIFLEECSDLYEYSILYKRGKLYSTNVNGKSLLDILKEYCILKNASEKNNSIANFSESVLKEKVKVVQEESIRNAVEQVIQKYLPCFCRKSHHRSDLLTDITQVDHTCDHNVDKSIELENEIEKMDQSNNSVILVEKPSKRSPNCYESSVHLKSTDCDINSLTEEFISKNLCKFDGLDHKVQLDDPSVSDRIYMQDTIKVEKDSENCKFLEHKSGDDCSKNKEINSHTPSTDSEDIMLLHSTDNNSVAVESFDKVVSTTSNQDHNTVKSCKPMQTSHCCPRELKQTMKVEPDSSINSTNQTEGSNCSQNNSTVTHVVGNHNSLAESNETAFCSIQSTRGSANTANPINLINSQLGYAIHPFASHGDHLPVSNMSYPSFPTYFVQNCPSNSSLLHNSQYSYIINMPATRTATTFPLAIPGILPDNNGPTLTSVTSLSSHNPPPVSSIRNHSSSNKNATAAAESTNNCEKSQTDSAIVLRSVCKTAEALLVAPPKTRKNALKSNLLTRESNQKRNYSKRGDLNNHKQQLCSKKKNKYENLVERHKKQEQKLH